MVSKRSSIILIRPRTSIRAMEMPNPPIGLGYLSSYLELYGYRVYLLDLLLRNIRTIDLIALIKNTKPVAVGISILTAYYMSAKTLCLEIKQELPLIPIILGGVHPSSLPELSLNECNADFVVIGEGEKTMLELIKALESKKRDFSSINGIAYKENDKIQITEPRTLIPDLDMLPMPAWDKINPNHYPKDPHGSLMKYSRLAPIISTRGCPFRCNYCASCRFWRQTIRYRSPVKVVDEIQYLHDHFGIREISFWDDNLTFKREHIRGICLEIIKRGLNSMMVFSTPNGVRVDTLDESILKLMKAAGFYFLTFAVESGSIQVLKRNGKTIDLKKLARISFIAKEIGFVLNSYFIIGFPTETVDNIKRTIQFARSLPFDMKTFFILKPLPGSKTFNDFIGDKDLSNYDWNNLHYMIVTDNVSSIDPKILKKWFDVAYRSTIYPRFLRFFFFRFVKYGHIFQIKVMLRKVMQFLTGFGYISTLIKD